MIDTNINSSLNMYIGGVGIYRNLHGFLKDSTEDMLAIPTRRQKISMQKVAF